MAKKKKAVRRKKQAAASIGLSPSETRTGTDAADALHLLDRNRPIDPLDSAEHGG